MRVNLSSASTRLFIFTIAIFLQLQCCGRSFSSTEMTLSDAKAIRRQACRELQSSCDQLVAAHPKDPAITSFQFKLARLDAAANDILHDLHLYRMEFFQHSLATVDGPSLEQAGKPAFVGAAAIVDDYAAPFTSLSHSTDLTKAELQILDLYLNAAIISLTQAVQSRGQACVGMAGENASEVRRLAFALPVITSDPYFSLTAAAPSLPGWMTRQSALGQLITFAVDASRPRLGFALAHSATSNVAPVDPSQAYIVFVTEQSDAMVRTARYKAALNALRDGVGIASALPDQSAVDELSFRIAEVLETSQSARAAADEIEVLRPHCQVPEDYARASVLHLKYLYKAGQLSALVTEASNDLNDSRCQIALPRIIYIAWAVCRQQGMAASPWSARFLERFPDDPLAARIYLASAIDAIAQNNQDEGLRLLHFIEYRFPQSTIIPQAHQLRARLGATNSTTRP